jgi:hypothetical protein
MNNFCTLADNNFTEKVLALNASLKRHQSDYTLHLLCVDDQIFEKCNEPNIKKYKLADLLEADPVLRQAQSNPPSREALINTANNTGDATRLQFMWSLAPYFTWWCMENLPVDDVLYIDSDIYFFRDLSNLRRSVEECSVGIVEHRCSYNPVNGKYNVGIVYFKNNFEGYKVLTWWKNCLLKPDNEYAKTHGTCGDQKYLEVFEELTEEVKILDSDIGHLAPWNFIFHEYTTDGKIRWSNYTQDLLYCHFSNFKPDYKNNSYQLAPRHGFVSAPMGTEVQRHFIKHIADQYYNDLKEAHEKTKNSLRDDSI